MTGPAAARRAQRRRGWIAAAGVVAITVSSCGSGGASHSVGTTVPAAGPVATVRIGFLGSVTGGSGPVGASVENGEKLAISQFDAVDPPVKVELDAIDTASDPGRAKAGAGRLMADRVLAVIGPTSGDEAVASDPMFEQAGIPTIAVTPTETDLVSHGWRYFHRVVADDAVQGQAAGDYLVKSLHAATVAVIDDSSSYGRDLSQATADAATAAGATITSSDHLDLRQVPSLAARIVSASPQGVFFAGGNAAASRLITELRANDYGGKIMVGVGGAGDRLVAAAGASAEGVYLVCGCSGTVDNPDAQAFDAAYLAQFGTTPGPFAAEGYDATNAILQAIRSGDSAPGAINDYLATVDYTGITRTVRFESDGDWSGSTVYFYKVQDGQVQEVSPAG